VRCVKLLFKNSRKTFFIYFSIYFAFRIPRAIRHLVLESMSALDPKYN
jgi:hypothetical protein